MALLLESLETYLSCGPLLGHISENLSLPGSQLRRFIEREEWKEEAHNLCVKGA